MAAQDLFAPPSKEELAGTQNDANMDLFAPPTKEEMLGPHSSWLDTKLPGGTARGYIKGALNTLPTVGMVSGGLLGTAAEPGLGTVAGAGLGEAAGKALQNIGEKYLLDEDKNREQIYLDPVKAGLEGATAEGAGQIAGKGMKAISEIPVVQKGMSKAGEAASKAAEVFTGTPAKETQTYAKNADEIKTMARASDNSTAEAADQIRSKWDDQTQGTRKELNNQISGALKGNETRIQAKPVLESLEKAKSSIDADLYPTQVQQVQDIIDSINKKITPAGRMSIQDANAVKGFLQDKASSAYRTNGDIFNVGTEAAKGARSGGAVTRKLVNDAAPDIASANAKLAGLHDLEDNMNLNMLREGKPEASILAAGTGGNPRNAKALQELGDAVGHDMLGDAEKLAAMRTFGSPSYMAKGANGKTFTHLASGTGLGGLLGYEVGGEKGAVVGAGIGAGLTSPMALRTAIDAGLLGKSAINEIASTPAGRELLMKAVLPSPKGAPVQEVSPGLLQQLTEKDPGKNRSSMKQDR